MVLGGENEVSGTITLAGDWADDRTGYTDGTYIVNHSCSSSGYGLYYQCCQGTTITFGNETLTCASTNCDGYDDSNQNIISASSIPVSGSTMTITGGKLSKIGCQ